ncbi:MAG: MFS transporter [Ktedonobacteraceae bacterium]|nr:MFS transporter [Ktedonobacteraceae bacterium]
MTSPVQVAARRQGLALLLISIAQFMVVLDFSIVNVALPSIQKDLGFSTQNLQWVISAYALTLGGLLLLGGRLADLYGQRRLFSIGLVLFSLASFAGGLAPSSTVLILARVMQGLGAALLAPSALSLIATTFAEGEQRNKAFGLVNAVASVGFAAGAILGGLLTAGPGWRWVMFVNVPLGVATIILTPFVLQESRAQRGQRRVDVLGALTVTGGLVALVYALSQGWLSFQTLGLFALAIVLLATFVMIEKRSSSPLVRLAIFRQRNVTGANIVNALATGSFDTLVFVLTLYMQRVLGYSALETGLAFLPMAMMLLITSNAAARIITRVGIKPLLIGGVITLVVGLLLLTGLTANGTYMQSLLPGIIVVSLGMGPTFSTIIIAATAGVSDNEQGLASGLFNTTEQIGASLMLAIAVAASSSHMAALFQQGEQNEKVAIAGGLQYALFACVISVLLALLTVIFVIREKKRTSASRELASSSANVKNDVLQPLACVECL